MLKEIALSVSLIMTTFDASSGDKGYMLSGHGTYCQFCFIELSNQYRIDSAHIDKIPFGTMTAGARKTEQEISVSVLSNQWLSAILQYLHC